MKTGYLRVTHPCATLLRTEVPFAFDLHVLSTPPAFVLSQDQTLQFHILANHNRLDCYPIQNQNYLARSFYCSVFKDQKHPQVPLASCVSHFIKLLTRCQPFFYSVPAARHPAVIPAEQRGANIQPTFSPVNNFLHSDPLFGGGSGNSL